MCPTTEYRFHKGLNNRAENSYQLTHRKEKSLIKFKINESNGMDLPYVQNR